MRTYLHLPSVLFLATLHLGCGSDEEKPSSACELGTTTGCSDGKVCEAVVDGTTACFAPVAIEGRVFDVTTDAGIEGATVVARDANQFPVSGIAVTGGDGTFRVQVPAPRNTDGSVVSTSYTLRADASAYLTFPLAPRTALPIDVSLAEDGVVASNTTDVGLVPLEDSSGLGTLKGRVNTADPGGTLVVAGSVTAVADKNGAFTVFNVPAGAATVQGYLLGANFEPLSVQVVAGETLGNLVLEPTSQAAVDVSGQVQIVNAPGGSKTSVILAVRSTFDENAARGEAPPGLRAADVTGAFTIQGVPDGEYVALAAFENDLLVRDPDTSIGGTSLVYVTVSGSDVTISEGFKVTEALAVVSPDAEEVVSATPTFTWADDSGEEAYSVAVYDALGELVWEQLDLPKVTGSKNVSVEYAGPPLVSGNIYQFRATSYKGGGTPLSRTEDLRGVFRVE
jgi:hypothetical protein